MTGLAAALRLNSGLRLENRIAKAATSESLARKGNPTDVLFRLYETWSLGGAGLVITGNSTVSRRYRERMGNVVLDAQTDRRALGQLARAAKRANNAALVQLSHPGRQTNRFVAGDPVGPSDGPAVAVLGAFARPRALREEEIDQIIADFVHAAVLVREAGFDGVQIHAAHGYLASQFLSPLSNRRTDAWGGPLANRARFLLETVARTRKATGSDFTLAVKLNASDFQKGGFSMEESLLVVGMLERAGVDLLEISGGNFESVALLGFDEKGEAKARSREAYFLDFARRAKAQTRIPLMLTGGMRSGVVMKQALADGAIDIVGMARPLCLEPDLPGRLLRGEADSARPCVRPASSVRRLAAAAETGYYESQIARLARGDEPKNGMSPLRAALAYVLSDASRGLRRTLFGD